VIEAIVGLGRSMGKRVVAVGVENEQQIVTLPQMGDMDCHNYAFSPPAQQTLSPHIWKVGEPAIRSPSGRRRAGGLRASGRRPQPNAPEIPTVTAGVLRLDSSIPCVHGVTSRQVFCFPDMLWQASTPWRCPCEGTFASIDQVGTRRAACISSDRARCCCRTTRPEPDGPRVCTELVLDGRWSVGFRPGDECADRTARISCIGPTRWPCCSGRSRGQVRDLWSDQRQRLRIGDKAWIYESPGVRAWEPRAAIQHHNTQGTDRDSALSRGVDHRDCDRSLWSPNC
jgi:hypothetical protein